MNRWTRGFKAFREGFSKKGYYSDPANVNNEYFKQLFRFVDGVGAINGWNLSEAQNRERTHNLLVSSAKGNGTVYSIISRIAGAMGELSEFIELLGRDDTPLESHWAIDLLNHPNDIDTRASMTELIGMNLLSMGDSFVYAQSPAVMINKKRFAQLFVMPSHEVEIITGSVLSPIRGFKLKDGGHIYGASQVPPLNKDNVMFIRLPNPSSTSFYGLSPLNSILLDCDIDALAKIRSKATIENGGVVNIITPAQNGDYPDPLDDKRDLTQEMNERYKGKKTAVLTYGIEVHRLGDTPADMDLQSTMLNTIKRICNVYGFPIDLLEGQSTYANLLESKKMVYTLALRYMKLFTEGLTKFLGIEEEGLRFQLNTDLIEELKPDNRAVIETMIAMGSSVNERRELMGYPPVVGGDTITVPINSIPIEDLKGDSVIENII